MWLKPLTLGALLVGLSATAGAQSVTTWTPNNGDGTFTNPILWGDWPDPDVTRVGDTFYMVSTSMHYVPGCPILKSKNLVDWEMAGYAVARYDEDPRYDLAGGSLYLNGSWASSIRYHNGRFYVSVRPTAGAATRAIFPSAKPSAPRGRGRVPFSPNTCTTRACFSTTTGAFTSYTDRAPST